MTDSDRRVLEYPARSRDIQRPTGEHDRRSGSGRRLLGFGALLLLGGLAFGVWQHYARHLEVTADAEQHRDFVPSVRVEAVRASPGTMSVTLPATTNAFQAANIYARASGYITERSVDIGSHVKTGDLLAAITAPELDHQIAQAEASLAQADATSGTFMFTLTQSDVMRIRLYVPQDAAIGVKPGVDAVVRVPEIPDHTFPGKVARIADALDPATRTLMTEIDVVNPDGELSPGTYCTVELKIPRRTPSLIVPAGAMVFDRGGLHVLVVENGVAQSRKITEVRDLGTEVEVSNGVKEGDQVVLTPPVDLEDGSRVQVHAPTAAKAS